MKNNYDKIWQKYNKTHEKPDKKYSMLPTLLNLAEPLNKKIILDIGCGDGFFTLEFAKIARKIYGLDNSKKQIEVADSKRLPNVEIILGDMLKKDYPKSDLVSVPFVLGYLKSPKKLKKLLKKIYLSLNHNGKIIGILDDPKRIFHNNKKFGSIKKINNTSLREGAKLTIELYNKEDKLVVLNAYYHKKEIIFNILKEVGFKRIQWHKPIISKEGLEIYGRNYWNQYLKNLDVAYFSAKK